MLVYAASLTALSAQTLTSLASFNGADGVEPRASMVQGLDGNLYGTTQSGGANNSGTVFKINPDGVLTTLWEFCSLTGCPDGQWPSQLVPGLNGDLYGTTLLGGATVSCPLGCGTVFKITPGGTLTTLHTFCADGDCVDGITPATGLVQANNGSFYGATAEFGANNGGTIFRITPNGIFTTVYNFCEFAGCSDGASPCAPLIQGMNGNLYGTTQAGGTDNFGTVFKMTPAGSLTVLYSFTSDIGSTNSCPAPGLAQGKNGDLYGATESGGASDAGTLYKVSLQGAFTPLYSFTGYADGAWPFSSLAPATNGDLYGTTAGSFSGPGGTIFGITPGGAFTTVYSFPFSGPEGADPYGGLVQATNGLLYGTTAFGGASNDGTVFSLSVGLGPFVETMPASGVAGTVVKILGTHLTGATSVAFNGTAATFTVVRPSLITTTVPSGATSGSVEIVTPSGTLSSNVPFRVLP